MTALHDDGGVGTASTIIVRPNSLDQSQIKVTTMSKPSQRGFNLTSGLAPVFSDLICIDFMKDALQARVDVDCMFDGRRIRQRFYRARQRCRAQDNHSYDELDFRLGNFWLTITRRDDSTTRRRCAEPFVALGGERRIVYVGDIDLVRIDDDAE